MTSVKVKFRPSSAGTKEGTLYYQLIHKRIVRCIRTGYKLYPAEWNEGQLQLLASNEQTERYNYLSALEHRISLDLKRLQSIIRRFEQSGKPYTAEQIISTYITTEEDEDWFCLFAYGIVRQMKRIGKARLAETYASSVSSFLRFRGQEGDVRLEEMDSDLMVAYEAYLRQQGLVPNTTSFYMRNLRAIYNRAVEKELTTDHFPFRHVYTGVEKTEKRAAPLQVFRRIKTMNLTAEPALAMARDLFMFSFYTRGMSFIDMAYLKKKDLQKGILVYRRQKTGRRLVIKWEQPMQDIVNRYNDPASPYLLPIITPSGGNKRRQYLNAIHRMNTHLKEIGKRVNSPVSLTSYVSRHGWASIAKSQNISVSVISDAMGHHSEATTRIYLAELDSSMVDQANSKVIYSV